MKLIPIFFYCVHIYGSCLTIFGVPGSLTIHQAVAGKEPSYVSDYGLSYNLEVSPQKKATIVASLDVPLEPHTALEICMDQRNFVPLTLVPQNLISSIPEGAYQSQTIALRYSASVKAGVIAPSRKTIFFTLID